MESLVHPFEQAGLGSAPFRFIGMTEETYQACQGAPIQPGGSCDYCGQGIRYMFHIRSADGRQFKVGCDCVFKTNSKGTKIYTATERAVKLAKKKAAAKRLMARVEAAKQTLSDNPELLTDRPHPNEYFATQGKTERDYVEYMLDGWGAKGRTDACKIIEKAIA